MRQTVLLGALVLLAGCMTAEDRMDAAAKATLTPVASAPALTETVPVGSGSDAADDPAIWVNASAPAESLILGTDKQAGLYVYKLDGSRAQYLPVGRLNNVDVRQAVTLAGGVADLAVASNRSDNTVVVFSIDPATGVVAQRGAFPAGPEEPYGICAGKAVGTGGGLSVAVTYKSGAVRLFRYGETAPDSVRETGQVKLSGQVEGCVFDEAQNALFIGEEEVGLWRVDFAGEQAGAPFQIDRVGSGSGLIADVEGVGLWAGPGMEGYLVVSSQLADRYIVYERAAPNRLVGAFAIGPSTDRRIDGVSHTDGLEVLSAPLGSGFPSGLMVVQDDHNLRGSGPGWQTQNFKIVDWRAVQAVLPAGR